MWGLISGLKLQVAEWRENLTAPSFPQPPLSEFDRPYYSALVNMFSLLWMSLAVIHCVSRLDIMLTISPAMPSIIPGWLGVRPGDLCSEDTSEIKCVVLLLCFFFDVP